jgi:hypothetical protein
MNYWTLVILSFSVFITAVLAALKYRRMSPDFLPFALCIWIASVNELVSFLLSYNGYSNLPNNNIYILLEGLLIVWQFKKWKLFRHLRQLPAILALLLAGLWLYEIHSLATLNALHYYYRIFYAALVVICSINISNRLIISHHRLVKNPIFYICTAYILYFTVKILADTYWLYNPESSAFFLTAVFYSLALNNLVTNLLFTLAVLWIPKKPDYITL